MNRQRIVLVAIAALVLVFSLSMLVRNHLAQQRCAKFDLIWQPGQGCVPDPSKIILERGLKRTGVDAMWTAAG